LATDALASRRISEKFGLIGFRGFFDLSIIPPPRFSDPDDYDDSELAVIAEIPASFPNNRLNAIGWPRR